MAGNAPRIDVSHVGVGAGPGFVGSQGGSESLPSPNRFTADFAQEAHQRLSDTGHMFLDRAGGSNA